MEIPSRKLTSPWKKLVATILTYLEGVFAKKMGIVHGYLSFWRGTFFHQAKHNLPRLWKLDNVTVVSQLPQQFFVVYLSLGSSFVPTWIFDVVWLGLVLVIYSFFKEQKFQQDSKTRMKFHPTRFKGVIHNTNIVFGYPISGLRAGFPPKNKTTKRSLHSKPPNEGRHI